MNTATRRASSLTIFLADGVPDGLRTVVKSGWIGHFIVCPRSRFPEARTSEEFARTGVYVLCGPSEESDLPTIYVGEGDPTRPRLEQHYRQKDFWTSLIVFTAKDQLNKAHVQYLESRLVSLAHIAKRCRLDNKDDPQLPALAIADTASMENFLEEMLLIYPLLGLTAFEVPRVDAPLNKPKGVADTRGRPADTTLYLKRKGIVARGIDKAEGFVVLAGSQAVKDEAPSILPFLVTLRNSLVKQGLLVPDGDFLKLTQNYTFNSPSTAAGVMGGSSLNGRDVWKDDQGRTLKEIQEAAISSSEDKETTGTPRNPSDTVKLTQRRMLTFMASRPEGTTFSRHDLLCVGTGKPLNTHDRVTTLDGSHIGNIRDENTHPYSLLARGWVETVEIEEDGRTSTRLRLTPAGFQAAKEHAVELKTDYPSE